MTITQLSLAVVGVKYPNRKGPTRHFGIALCKPGDPVELRPEPKNPADPRAVGVWTEQGIHIGYLAAERAPWIGAMLANGRTIRTIFQERVEYGAVIRAAFDGTIPALPAPTNRGAPDQNGDDFYPDEIYPDD